MKISINLLPPEDLAKKTQRAKFYKVQFAGIAIILFLIFLTSLTLALRILQNRSMTVYQARLALAQQKVSDFKSTQASLVLLKDRLQVIDQYLGVPSKQSSIYQLIDKLMPQSVAINAISVDQAGAVAFTALVPDSITLDNLLSNLISNESNENKISQVSVEGLNRSREGFYRVGFKIKPVI